MHAAFHLMNCDTRGARTLPLSGDAVKSLISRPGSHDHIGAPDAYLSEFVKLEYS